ncbi:MAG: ATP-binding protein [Solirubrobacterales bacterium]|nr:ATP-binding protein [Solirubrobacterales bacterium]
MDGIERAITPRLLAALSDTPAVMLVGPRQAGKSTLVQALASGPHPARYLTLDDLRILEGARRDPVGLIESADRPLIIDEIQRAPELLLPIKAAIDRDRRPGRFMLTGSAQVMLLPSVSESLAGRVEVHTLWPFSQAEIEGAAPRTVELLLAPASEPPPATASSRGELIERIVRGGFPQAIARDDDRRQQWLSAYLTTIVQRDLRDLANIERLAEVPAVLTSLAARARAPLNLTEVASSVAIPRTSLHRYITLLEHVFLLCRLPAWHTNLIKQISKAPKLLICDSALVAHLLRADRGRLREDAPLLGVLLECFVGMELAKQLSAVAAPRAALYHMRTATGAEIDFLLEGADRRLAGVEVKASSTVRGDDFKHLAGVRDRIGERFVRGVVLYAGGERVSFGERLEAWPLATLWGGAQPR